MNFIFKAVLLLTLSFLKVYAQDIPTSNTGEQEMISSLRSAIDKTPKLKSSKIILGAGASGCEVFSTALAEGETHVLLSWQWLDGMNGLAPKTVLILPRHAIDERLDNIKGHIQLIVIDGVLHTKTLENIKEEPLVDIDPYTECIVMLAGDTQQEDAQWLLYDQKSAAHFIKDLPCDKKTLILNGPRTGKYRVQGDRIVLDETAHRKSVDYITEFVIEVAQDKRWKIVDFKYGEPSIWGPTLRFCVEHPNVALILPGESTSMISECLTLGILPIVYTHSAMTSTSQRYVQFLSAQGKILLYPSFENKKSYKQDPMPAPYATVLQQLQVIIDNDAKKKGAFYKIRKEI